MAVLNHRPKSQCMLLAVMFFGSLASPSSARRFLFDNIAEQHHDGRALSSIDCSAYEKPSGKESNEVGGWPCMA